MLADYQVPSLIRVVESKCLSTCIQAVYGVRAPVYKLSDGIKR